MARDNSRVAQALFIIAREHSGPSAKWERTLSRRLAIATAAAGPAKVSPLIRLARTTGSYPETGLRKLLRWFPLMPDTFPACLRAPRTNYWQLA
jgi:hypothetical protein